VPDQQLLSLVRPQGFVLVRRALRCWGARGTVVLAASLAVALIGCTASSSPPGSSASPPSSQSLAPDRVPELTGLSRSDASKLLGELGVTYFVVPAGPPLDDTVVDQKPQPGTPLKGLKKVVIFARCQAAPCPSPAKGEILYDPCSCSTR
jgi:hypothetical protein